MRPRRGYLDGPHGQIHYRELGAGHPLLLLHQAAMDSRQFDAVYAPLAQAGFRVIGIDMPGFGNSDCPFNMPLIPDLAVGVAAALDELGLKSVFVAGHHTGGMVGTELAITRPDLVAKLIIHSPMPLTDDERADFFANKHIEEKNLVPVVGGAHFVAFTQIRERLSEGTISPERISQYVIQCFGAEAPFWYGHYAAFSYRHDLRLAELRCPTLLLTNSGDQIFEHAKRACAIRPDLPFQVIEGGGIDIMDQLPAEWARAVKDFFHT